jgi:hypothetical protein
MVQKLFQLKNRFMDFYQHNEVLVTMIVFAFGFALDLYTLGRIDSLFNLIQQAVYLILLGTFLLVEIKISIGTMNLSGKAKKFWGYHNLVVHFLFGSLLSIYTIFYYTSASAFTSFVFILLLAILMLANEIPKIRKLGLPVRVILFCICVLSYFSFFYPILMGHIGQLPFWMGLLSSALVMALIWKLNFKNHEGKGLIARNHVLRPTIAVHLFFLIAYYTSLIPPVPVAVKKIGVYYGIEKKDGDYIGKYLKSNWIFFSKGSQEFHARAGDKVTIILSIFSPARFKDQVTLKWYRDDEKKGWKLEDTIPLNILGGRDQGFRGFGMKEFYVAGKWKVLVETSDGREVGRINLEIFNDYSINQREFTNDYF